MRDPTREAHDLRETYRSELDRRTLLWPAVHDPLADTDTETESAQSVKVTETDENNVEKDTLVAMAGLVNEEKPAGGQGPEGAAQEEREMEDIYRALDAISAEGPEETALEEQEQEDSHGALDGILAEESEETAQEKRDLEDIHRALDEIFAEAPQRSCHQSIPQLTEAMVAAVEASAGRARKATHVPFLVGHEKEAREDREQYLRLCARVRSAPDPASQRVCRQARNEFCRHMRTRRRHWKGAWLKRLIQRVEEAAEMGDWGRFYQVLRELGQSTYDLKRRDKQEHTAPALRTHYAAISAEINEVRPEVLAELRNPLPINEELSTPPNNVEVMGELKK